MWGMFCHLAALVGFIGVPLGSVLGPLVVWLIKREESPFVNEQGREAVNFQLSMLIYFVVAGLLCFILIGIPLIIGLVIFDLVMVILAGLRANNGETYRYPLTIRFIK
jgi:uncharacterized Tic20 family protein